MHNYQIPLAEMNLVAFLFFVLRNALRAIPNCCMIFSGFPYNQFCLSLLLVHYENLLDFFSAGRALIVHLHFSIYNLHFLKLTAFRQISTVFSSS